MNPYPTEKVKHKFPAVRRRIAALSPWPALCRLRGARAIGPWFSRFEPHSIAGSGTLGPRVPKPSSLTNSLRPPRRRPVAFAQCTCLLFGFLLLASTARAQSDGQLYIGAFGGDIYTADLDGGNAGQLFDANSSNNSIISLSVSGETLWMADSSIIYRSGLDGSALSSFNTLGSKYSVAAGNARVWALEGAGLVSFDPDGSDRVIHLSIGSGPEQIPNTATQMDSLLFHEGMLYWIDTPGYPFGTPENDRVYRISRFDPDTETYTPDFLELVNLDTNENGEPDLNARAAQLAFSEDHLYVANDRFVEKMDPDGSDRSIVFENLSGFNVTDLLYHEGTLYMGLPTDSQVWRLDTTAASPFPELIIERDDVTDNSNFGIKSMALLPPPGPPPEVDSSISGTANHAWGQNSGWINFNRSGTGVAVFERFLGGWAWCQNTGWIGMGDGSPENGFAYANDSTTDYGVNCGPGGVLTGQAWSPNVGWITFEQTHGLPRIDLSTGEFSGYAWAPNLGWINLGESFASVPVPVLTAASAAPVDDDGDGLGDGWERLHFGSTGAVDGTLDSDGDGRSDADEYLADSDPNDPQDYLRIVSHDTYNPEDIGIGTFINSVTIEWTSSSRRLYDITHSTTLDSFDITAAPVSGVGDIPGDPAGPTTTHNFGQDIVGDAEFWRVEAKMPLAPAP